MNKPIKILVAGDLLPSEENYALFERGDVVTLFGDRVCQLFGQVDFSIANLEGPLTDSTVPQIKDGPIIKAPRATVTGIQKLGLSAVALANNHITDYLQHGIDETLSILNEVGIKHVGIVPRKGEEGCSDKYYSFSIDGRRICIYNVSETFFNRPSKETSGANVYDEWIVLNEIKALKQKHDFLIVIYHGGAEYFPYPTPQTRTRFHRMVECGADFITAQHTHCIGCEEWYNGSYLLYGQGNFLFARQIKYPNLTKQGLITEIIITDNGFSVKNHVVNIKDNVICYDEGQDLSSFYERSERVDDEEYIIDQFTKLKVEEIMQRYLLSSKGDYPLRRVTRRLFPNSIKHPEVAYDYSQLLRNFDVLQGERRREDMYYVWLYLLKKYPLNER